MKMIKEEEIRDRVLMETAGRMAAAARTAPKGRGMDEMEIRVVQREAIEEIADEMEKMVDEGAAPPFFRRDAGNIRTAGAMLLLGSRIRTAGLSPCGMCGFPSCKEKEKHPRVPCAFNTGDLGIALGSAVSVAMDHRVDNRVMYTVGQAVIRMKLLGPELRIVYGIPLSVASKNPYFDRKKQG